MIGPDLCPKCKGLHYRRDPCIVRKQVIVIHDQRMRNLSPEMLDKVAEDQAAKRGPGRPKTITNMKAYKANWQSKYRAEVAAGIRIPKRRDEK